MKLLKTLPNIVCSSFDVFNIINILYLNEFTMYILKELVQFLNVGQFATELWNIEIHINTTLQRTTKNSLSRAGFELASSSFKTADLPIELSSQLGLVASLI